jgi:hypothetical protein
MNKDQIIENAIRDIMLAVGEDPDVPQPLYTINTNTIYTEDKSNNDKDHRHKRFL